MDCWIFHGAPGKKFWKFSTPVDWVRFYVKDNQKFEFPDETHGRLVLTSHRLHYISNYSSFALDLRLISRFDKELKKTFLGLSSKTPKIVITVTPDSPGAGNPGTTGSALKPFEKFTNLGPTFKIGFIKGRHDEFYSALNAVIQECSWKRTTAPVVKASEAKIRRGIMGIESEKKEASASTVRQISAGFHDIETLISSAKPMLQLIGRISEAVKAKNVSEDETTTFRQHLLSLGIPDPVTKSKCPSDNDYYSKLARECSLILSKQIKETGGLMSLVEAFMRVNRARGYDIASPEDLLTAFRLLESLALPIRLKKLEGTELLQHVEFLEDHYVNIILTKLETNPDPDEAWISPENYAREDGIPLLLAKHSLVLAESRGLLVRDESIEGLRFYSIEKFNEPYELLE